jgi:hypothetical protein
MDPCDTEFQGEEPKMRIIKMLAVLATLGMIAGPAMAATQIYSWTADNAITSPTAPVGGFTLFPAGTWEGAHSRVLIDPTGNAGEPLLVSFLVQSDLVNAFDCLGTSGVPGCVVVIKSQTITEGAGAGNLPGTVQAGVSNLGGDIVTFPDAAVNILFPPAGPSLGQFCSASIDPNVNPNPSTGQQTTIANYCANVLGLTQDAWSTSLSLINPISPNNAGEWHFSADYSAYEIPNAYRYFQVAGAENTIYGNYLFSSGSTPRALPVPLAPIAALALGGSLAYMGVTSLRRKS